MTEIDWKARAEKAERERDAAVAALLEARVTNKKALDEIGVALLPDSPGGCLSALAIIHARTMVGKFRQEAIAELAEARVALASNSGGGE